MYAWYSSQAKCRVMNRNDGNKVIGTMHEKKADGLFVARIIVTEHNPLEILTRRMNNQDMSYTKKNI